MSKIMELADSYANGLENYARGDKYDIRLRDALAAEVEKLEAENKAIRTLMNCYNLGGWTDSLTLMKERDALREKLAAMEATK